MEQFADEPVFLNLVVLWEDKAVIDFVFNAGRRSDGGVNTFEIYVGIAHILQMTYGEVVLCKGSRNKCNGDKV